MRIRAGMVGAVMAGVALSAHAQSSPYASMAVPGGHNGWDTTPGMVLVANNTWVCTQTFSSANGEFKFAANGNWDVNWGGNATLARVPAIATAITPTDTNLKYAGLSNGNYRITFNDATREFRIEWVGAAPLPPPAIGTLSLVGNFNGWNAAANPMTNHPAPDTNVWSVALDLYASTTFQFFPDGTWSNQFGAPEAATVAVPGLGIPVTNNACGKSDYTLSGFAPGTFRFELNTTNNLFTVVQTATQSFTIATMTVQGNFIATSNPPVNMMRIGDVASTSWESDHHITNSGTITLRFAANGGVQSWGATNVAPVPLPASGTLATGVTAYAQVSGVATGRYRVTFNHQTGAYTFRQVYPDSSGLNLLKNPGFEQTTSAEGGDAVNWGSWQAWPKRVADGFLPHSGNWCGAIHSQMYPDWTDYASFAQDVLVTAGKNYRASAWLKATADWTADYMQIKLEWRDAADNLVGSESTANIPALTTDWVKYSVEGVAPAGATKAHVVFLCSGSGTAGTMHVDDVEMRAVAGRSQNFDTWGTLTAFGPFAPDWSITSGKVVYNVPPGRPAAEVLISQYVEGTGNNKAVEIYNGTLGTIALTNYFLQQYDNGATNPSVSIQLSGSLGAGETVVVGRPGTPANYAPDEAIGLLPNLWTNKFLTFNGDDVVVLRQGGTNGTVKDRVGQVGTNATGSIWSRNTKDRTLTRKQTVFTGTVNAVTSAFPLLDEWEISAADTFDGLGSHDISYIDPNEPYTPAGYSLVMNTNAILMSGDLPGGVGDISFWYRTESMTPPVDISIESGPAEDGPWTTNDTLAGVARSNFTYFVVGVNRPDHRYVRIRQTDGGTNRFRLDEVTVAEPSTTRRTEDFQSWTDPAYELPGTYARNGWALQGAIAPTSGNFNTRGGLVSPPDGSIVSPAFEGGVGETLFWAKALESGETAYLLLQTSTDGGSNWTTRASFNVTTARSFSAWLYLPTDGAQARLAFDTNQSSGDVLIDSIEVRAPELHRNQDFDGWPTRGSYVTETVQGWFITNSIVDSQNAYAGQVARLNSTVGNYVQSPEIPDGLGTLSFRTRKWSASDGAFTLQVQLSSNAVNWITLTNVSATSTNYQQFTWFLQDATNRYLRLYHSAGAVRVPIDDIRINELQPRPEVVAVPGLDPSPPLLDTPMDLVADVVSRYGASILSVTGFYAIGSTTNRLAMTNVTYGSYASVSNIPGQPAGTLIRYYVQIRYAGVGAATNSTGYTTNTYTSAIYSNFISTVPLGNVWINEIFYAPYDLEPWEMLDEDPWWELVGCNHEFIELCGVADSDISGWRIQLAFGSDTNIAANGGQPVYATYTIPPGTVFTNQTNGFSFYVLGDAELSGGNPVDQVLSTLVPTNISQYGQLYGAAGKDHIHDVVGVIRLVDQFGNVVYSLAYGGFVPNSDRIPQNQLFAGETNSIGLVNTGSAYDDFAWDKGDLTIGRPNDSQTLEEPEPPTEEYAYGWHTQTQKITPVNTNDVPPFHMLDPRPARHNSTNDIYYGFTNAAYPIARGTLHHRASTAPAWSTLTMGIRAGSLDAAGYAYVWGRIPAYAYDRLQTIQYVIEVDANKSGVASVYLGSDAGGNNVSTIYTNLAAARASPFTYLVPISDRIFVTNFVVGATNVILQTEGNDPVDPLVNFYVKFTTNMLVSTNAWIATNFTRTTNIYGQSTFNVPRGTSLGPRIYYRIDPRWP